MDFHRLFDLPAYQALRYPNPRALNWRFKGRWEGFTIGDCQEMADRVSATLLRQGCGPGAKIGMVSRAGSPHWLFLDLGIQQIGAVTVPVHSAVMEEELVYILRHAGVKICFAGEPSVFDFLTQVRAEIPTLGQVYMIGPDDQRPSSTLLLHSPAADERERVKSLAGAVSEADLATIIYTSGTTGSPKGVMLSHKNMVSNIKSIMALLPVNFEKRVISYLPITHIFERMVVYTYLAAGAAIYFAESTERLWMNLREVRPNYFTAVPLVLERFYRHLAQETQKAPLLKRKIGEWALRLASNYREPRPGMFYKAQLQLADALVFRKWRKALGGDIEGIAVGAAALAPELGKIFSAAGIKVREGYGLTETAPIVAFNRFEPGGVRFGTVGIPIPGVEVRIHNPDEQGEGEILVRGPNVMMGYFQDEGATQKVLDTDGWLWTGDIGQIVHKRFLKISGRKNEIFKTSAGKFIVPPVLERIIKTSPFVDQVIVLGANRPALGALIVPDFQQLEAWCQENNVHWTAPAYMVLNLKVQRLFENEFNRLNTLLPSFEQIGAFHLLHQPWGESSGELTPTMKIRRKFIEQKYQHEIRSLFQTKK
ncbi:MAG: AMP-dependent synthetase/ligase [Saprospiraceae bacterium]